jgi:hypothetical protein
MRVPDELYALLPRAEADDVVAELRHSGIHASEIVVRHALPGRYELDDERLHEEVAGTRHGAELGAVIGAVVGLVAAAFVPVLRDAGLLGWVVAAFGGAGFGALMGAMTGLQRHEHADDDPAASIDVTPDSDLQLLEVRCLHLRNRAHHVVERHGGVAFVTGAQPVG